jgi:hypothetical protein
MRLLTGVLFGFGIVWFGLPFLDASFTNLARVLKARLQGSELGI